MPEIYAVLICKNSALSIKMTANENEKTSKNMPTQTPPSELLIRHLWPKVPNPKCLISLPNHILAEVSYKGTNPALLKGDSTGQGAECVTLY